jgi:exopolysaccharide biosynthesis predicted pyruvyltransferase EpsI
MNHLELVARLRGRINAALDPHVPAGATVAVVDFPSHGNVGDNAIWLGEMAYLKHRHARIAFACDIETYSAAALRERVSDGPILIHGGGNLGDVWPEHQRFRTRVISDFPHNPIVQFPQTIHFKDRAGLEEAKRAFGGHPRLAILVRDTRSLEFARREFPSVQVELSPDMAFFMGPLERPLAPSVELVKLLRTDSEAAANRLLGIDTEQETVDWITDDITPLTLLNRVRPSLFLRSAGRDWTGGLSWLRKPLAAAFDAVARERVQRGARVLSRGHQVVTDRLHAHILSLLLGIPHILIDNNYGKVKGYYETWTKECDLVEWFDSGAAVPPVAIGDGASV